ncbi:MAG: amino acid ABC transporter ATP-binding protein [Planctomycetes bacterium]|nr:amino acid ABC transporter ATP-binding protein [Planctomycetota bacterium]
MPETAVATALLEAQGLKKRYGDFEVLKGIDLKVNKGEVVAVLGPNGCGKSTFLRCLNLLEPYQDGRVLLDGEIASVGIPSGRPRTRAEEAAAQALRRRMGMVFQRFNLFPHMSVLDNVMLAPRKVRGMSGQDAREMAERMIAKVGMNEFTHRAPKTLSGGQQQRAAIARALAMEPEVLLLDEITSALDPAMTREVFKVVRALAGDGITMLLVTHDLPFARDTADRAVVIHKGLVAADGTPEAVLSDALPAELRELLAL